MIRCFHHNFVMETLIIYASATIWHTPVSHNLAGDAFCLPYSLDKCNSLENILWLLFQCLKINCLVKTAEKITIVVDNDNRPSSSVQAPRATPPNTRCTVELCVMCMSTYDTTRERKMSHQDTYNLTKVKTAKHLGSL